MNDRVNFTPLSKIEVARNFEYLIKNKTSVVIWEKGNNQKEEGIPTFYNEEKSRISYSTVTKGKSEFIKKSILINFMIKGLNFFGKGKVIFDASLNTNVIELTDEFYKCERRSTFRLLTYPVHSVLAVFRIDENFEDNEKANLLDFSAGKEEMNDDIFDQFISLISDGNPSTDEEQVVFRIYDISVNGVAITVGTLEKHYFIAGKILKNFNIVFNGEEFLIPKAKVVYLNPYTPGNKADVEQFKVGVQFLELPSEIDNRLGKVINKNMKVSDMKRIFEDFLK